MQTTTRPTPQLPILEGLPAELAAAVGDHNAAVAAWAAKRDEQHSQLADDRQSPTAQAVAALRDLHPVWQAEVLEAEAELWEQRIALVDRLAAQFRQLDPELDSAYVKALAAACNGLERVGLGLESRPGWRVNQAVAQRQLEALAADALPVRAAAMAVTSNHGRLNSMREWRSESEQGRDTARRLIKQLATGGNSFATTH